MGEDKDLDCINAINEALALLRENKPNERSEKARRYAVTITEMEKVAAYFKEYIILSDV